MGTVVPSYGPTVVPSYGPTTIPTAAPTMLPTTFPTKNNFHKSRPIGKELGLNEGRGGMCVKGGTGKPEAGLPPCSPDLAYETTCTSTGYDGVCEVSNPAIYNYTDGFPAAAQGCCWARFFVDITDKSDCECDERNVCYCDSFQHYDPTPRHDPIPT